MSKKPTFQELDYSIKDYIDRIKSSVNEMIVNVKDFGAKGDGITNDYIAIQNALDTGLSVYFPYTEEGYAINNTLLLKSKQALYGESRKVSIIQKSNNTPIIRVIGSHFHIYDLTLKYYTQQNETMTNSIGIELGDASTSEGAYEGCIERIIIEKPYRGISIPSWTGNAFAFMNTMNNVRVYNSWDFSFHLGSNGIGLTTNFLSHCYALHDSGSSNTPNGKGFYIANHDDFTMQNCACDHATEEALLIQDCAGGTIIDFHAEACKISKDWQCIINIQASNVNFTNIQLPYNIINAGVSEAYFLGVYEESHVTIGTFVERNTINNGTGTYYAIVNDTNSYVSVEHITHTLNNYFNGKKNIGTRSFYNNGEPTKGAWKQGDVIYNEKPMLGSYVGWVCITGGDFSGIAPIFKGFGLIDGKTYIDDKIKGKIHISPLDPTGGNDGDIWFKYKE